MAASVTPYVREKVERWIAKGGRWEFVGRTSCGKPRLLYLSPARLRAALEKYGNAA